MSLLIGLFITAKLENNPSVFGVILVVIGNFLLALSGAQDVILPLTSLLILQMLVIGHLKLSPRKTWREEVRSFLQTGNMSPELTCAADTCPEVQTMLESGLRSQFKELGFSDRFWKMYGKTK